jgi:hypothetical protein
MESAMEGKEDEAGTYGAGEKRSGEKLKSTKHVRRTRLHLDLEIPLTLLLAIPAHILAIVRQRSIVVGPTATTVDRSAVGDRFGRGFHRFGLRQSRSEWAQTFCFRMSWENKRNEGGYGRDTSVGVGLVVRSSCSSASASCMD